MHRAATLNGIADNLLHEEPSLDAEPWYDQLGRIEDMRIDVTIDGETITLACPRNEKDNDGQILQSRRADRIVVRLDVRRGETVTVLELPSDLAIDGDQWGFSLEEAGVLATADSELEVPELQALLEEAFFTPSDEEKAPTRSRRRRTSSTWPPTSWPATPCSTTTTPWRRQSATRSSRRSETCSRTTGEWTSATARPPTAKKPASKWNSGHSPSRNRPTPPAE